MANSESLPATAAFGIVDLAYHEGDETDPEQQFKRVVCQFLPRTGEVIMPEAGDNLVKVLKVSYRVERLPAIELPVLVPTIVVQRVGKRET